MFIWEFLNQTLVDGFSQEFEWHQVSSNIQDSSEYPDRSQQCCSLDVIHFLSNS